MVFVIQLMCKKVLKFGDQVIIKLTRVDWALVQLITARRAKEVTENYMVMQRTTWLFEVRLWMCRAHLHGCSGWKGYVLRGNKRIDYSESLPFIKPFSCHLWYDMPRKTHIPSGSFHPVQKLKSPPLIKQIICLLRERGLFLVSVHLLAECLLRTGMLMISDLLPFSENLLHLFPF